MKSAQTVRRAVLWILSAAAFSAHTHAQAADSLPSSDDGPAKQPTLKFVRDVTWKCKPVGIHKFIGRRPIAAFGNSDGDLQMLQWTAAGAGKRLAALVHHTDADREWAYDRQSPIGRRDKAVGEARRRVCGNPLRLWGG